MSKWHSNTNPRPGQYLTHAHRHITWAMAAMDSCFGLVMPHQHSIAVGQKIGLVFECVTCYDCCFKVAQNNFQHFPRFWWVIITTLHQLMLQSWYQRTAQSLLNTLVSQMVWAVWSVKFERFCNLVWKKGSCSLWLGIGYFAAVYNAIFFSNQYWFVAFLSLAYSWQAWNMNWLIEIQMARETEPPWRQCMLSTCS